MKKQTKKLIAAGIVMVLSCGAWGSVQATDYNSGLTESSYTDDVLNLTTDGISYPADADCREMTISSKIINFDINKENSLVVGADAYTSEANKFSKLVLGNENTEEINIAVKGEESTAIGLWSYNYADNGKKSFGNGSEFVVTSKILNIDVSGADARAITVQNNTQNSGSESEPIAENRAKMTINADTIKINSSGVGLQVISNGQLDIIGDLNLTGKGSAIETRGYSTTNINVDGNHKTVINGDIKFATPNIEGVDGHNSGNKIDATVNINFKGQDSSWTGKAYQELGTKESIELENNSDYYGDVTNLNLNFSDDAQWNMTGDSFANHVTAENGAAINVTDNVTKANIDTVKLNDGTINLQGTKQAVKVNTIDGDGTVTTTSLDNNLAIGTKVSDATIKVEGTGEIGDQILAGKANLDTLAKVVSNNDRTKSMANTIETQEGQIAGKIIAKVGADGQVDPNSIERPVNTYNQAISNMATISLMTWRQENNDMNKRLGELRASQGSQGVWARMARGQAKYGEQSIKNQYNYYQLGYDSKISDDWILGGAFTYTDGESSYTNGSGTNKHTGFAIYGSNLRDDGSFIDIIAKYAHMKNDFDVNGGVEKGDYSTNGYALSAEYGKRFHQDGFWIEPQAELTYGKVSSVDFQTKNGASVHQDSLDSLVGRLGFSLGKDIKQGNVYLRASYLYDFKGETAIQMTGNGVDSGHAPIYKSDIGGSWWEFGVGTNLNLGHDTHFYLDVETTAGGHVDTPWQWNAGVRFSF